MSCLCLAFAATVLVGCGGGATDDGDSKDPAANSGTGSAVADDASTAPAGSGTRTLASGESGEPATPTGPAAGTGIQLPDEALPEDGGKDSDAQPQENPVGPTQPGAGGIEMPDLNSSSQSDSTPQSVVSTKQGETEVPLQFASWSAIESRAKSTGKITVVDLWSTVCPPCVEEFPGLVRLSKAMPDDVTCIGVSVDYDGRKSRPPESYTEKVGGFLSAVGAEFDNYLCNTPSDDVFAAVDLPSIPAVLIYDATGKLVKRFIDSGDTIGFSYDADVIPFVEKLAG